MNEKQKDKKKLNLKELINNLFKKEASSKLYLLGIGFIVFSIVLFLLAGPVEITERVQVYYDGTRYRWEYVTRLNPVFFIFFSLFILFILLGVFVIIFTYRNTRLNNGPLIVTPKQESAIEKEDVFSIEKKLLELKNLRDKEIITVEEYKELRKKVLDSRTS